MSEEKKVVLCPVCGEQNINTATYCNDCGAVINTTLKKGKTKKIKREAPGNVTISKKTDKKSIQSKYSANKIVIYCAIGSLLLGFLIIVSSGIFEPPILVDAHAGHNHEGGGATGEPTGQLNTDLGGGQQIDPNIMTLEKELATNPNNVEAQLQLANSYFDANMPDKAIPLYKKYLETKPNTPDVLVDLGVCYFNKNDFIAAQDYFKQAIVIDPKHLNANLNLGVTNLSLGKKDEAITWFNKTIEINPSSDAAKRAQDLIEKNK